MSAKPMKEGAVKASTLSIEPTETRTVIPYKQIGEALKKGDAYVLDVTVKNKHTLAQARNKLSKDTGINVKLGKVKGTEQFVFYP